MQLLRDRRNLAKVKVSVLKALMQYGFTDGIQQLSFNTASLGANQWLTGWFKGVDGIFYRFEWRGNTLTYQQTTTTQPLQTHTVTLPNPRSLTRRMSSEQKGQQNARIRDRATFSCAQSRSPRNRRCSVSGVTVERKLKELLNLLG